MKKHLLIILSLAFLSINAQVIKLDHKYYETYFDTSKCVPVMAHHMIIARFFKDTTNVERSANFKKDPLIKNNKQYGDPDFTKGFDKGHLVPDADMKWSQESEKSTMLYTNCAPQYSKFNRGLWKSIESYVRSLMGSYDTIHVWTGCIYDKNNSKIPKYFWKAIQLKLSGVTINTIGFMCENKDYAPKTFPQDHACTVKHIESFIMKTLFKVEELPGFNDPNRESVLKNNDKMIKPH